MNKIRDVIIKASSFWVLIGTLLISLGSAGVDVPTWVPELFSQAFIDNLLIVLGAVIDYVSFIRGIFAVTNNDDEADVQTLSTGKVISFYMNPFKMAA